MKIGSLALGEMPLFLAPMEDVTYKSFRYMCRKYGVDVTCTEFISSDALVRDIERQFRKMTLFDFDRPCAIQLYGKHEKAMEKATQLAAEKGPDYIDINFGCPVKKIATKGAGAGFLQDLDKMQSMAAIVVKSTHLPVTAKTRLGWDHESKPIIEIAKRLQDVGIQALTIHGRTRSQLYTGEADWTLIGEVKNHPSIHIPIIGNGDVSSAVIAKKRIDETGVDGLMIGRGAIGRPWLFREIKHYLQTGTLLPLPTVSTIVEDVKEQLKLSIEWKEDERRGILEMRRHFVKYFWGVENFREYKVKLLTAETQNEVLEILNRISVQYHHDTPIAPPLSA